jgi:hypothetical protein
MISINCDLNPNIAGFSGSQEGRYVGDSAVFEADRKPVVHSSYHMLFLLQLNVKATFIISCQYCAFHNYSHFSTKADCKLAFYIAKGAVAQCH